jgi:tetratricopeptide (TPR) repeat protein
MLVNEHYMESLKNVEKIYTPFLFGIRLNNIVLIFIDLKDYDKALDYLQKALTLAKQIGDNGQIASQLSNIGLIDRCITNCGRNRRCQRSRNIVKKHG